ncbi:MAG: marine proteobacterial sortase target protein [Proteobacteria bacterium]|nr:marine proteobacterial sortase target protein [Pseudomonadota bacterium]
MSVPLVTVTLRRGLIFLLLCVGLTRTVSANELAEAGAGQLFFEEANGHRSSALHLESNARFRISGVIAHVELTQQFRNQTDDWQEAIYVLPMNETAAVNQMDIRIGGRIIKGVIKEKAEARKTYNTAKAQGKKAALVEQSRPNLFQQAVANIAPGETITVTLSYVQTVDYNKGEFGFRFPMTLTPRFIPAGTLVGSPDLTGSSEADEPLQRSPNTKGWAIVTSDVPDGHLITPRMKRTDVDLTNPIGIEIELDPGLELQAIGSPYHNISVKKEAGQYRVELVEGRVSMDRDFVLNWRPVVGDEPRAAVSRETLDGEDYVLLMMLPPSVSSGAQPIARDMVFVIDTSGSMQGTSIEQAKVSLGRALDRLRPQDRFNIIEFNSSWSRLFADLQYPDAYYLKTAKDWVSRLGAGGGTNMQPALEIALAAGSEEQQLKHIVFITDGAVGNEQGLFKLISEQLGDTRLFLVGIGSAPNSFFMRQAAEYGRGTFTHIGSLSEVSEKMDQLFTMIDSPVAADIRIEWPQAPESYPTHIPAIYQGEPLLVAAKGRYLHGSIVVHGTTAAAPWSQELSLDTRTSKPGVGTIWARRKISALEDDLVKGRDATAVKNEMVQVAIAHKMVTRDTSLVAVEEIVSRLAQDTLKTGDVPNAVPYGQVAMYPQTATSAPLSFLVGLLSLLAAMFLIVRDWHDGSLSSDQEPDLP